VKNFGASECSGRTDDELFQARIAIPKLMEEKKNKKKNTITNGRSTRRTGYE
jgi:hypothetical protein